jgi:cytochrome c peroxidase
VVAAAQIREESGLGSLKRVRPPAPSRIDDYVRDFRILTVLGKALFWDMQVGSDGRTACATCHFHAGADHRRQNQLASTPDVRRPVPLNRVLTADDFPFHLKVNPLDARSAVLRDNRWIAGSAGVPFRTFAGVGEAGAPDSAADPAASDAPAIGGLRLRQVTARNTPSVINAVFNVRNFWDGRASEISTAHTPFGDSDTGLNMLVCDAAGVTPTRFRMERSSLASQAAGPPLNATEMSWAGRSWATLGKRLLPLTALAGQAVAADDSVLADFVPAGDPQDTARTGLRTDVTYAALVAAAFAPRYWDSRVMVDERGRVIPGRTEPGDADAFTVMEFNFPLFFTLAIQAYESTLVADDTRFDRYADGDTAALTEAELSGLRLFQSGSSQCSQCHGGPELTAASFTAAAGRGFDATRPDAFGFFRVGVSPVSDDVGAGGRDAFGMPFFPSASHAVTRGVFKTPGLRNVELTGPYFHTGGAATLGQALDVYLRRGDFLDAENRDARMDSIALDERDKQRLLAFLLSLTDGRVRYERAPFDHPALCVPVGHPAEEGGGLLPNEAYPGAPIASDAWALVPAVGRMGNAVPLQTFDELLRGIGNDGSRAHTMTTPCPQVAPPGRPAR